MRRRRNPKDTSPPTNRSFQSLQALDNHDAGDTSEIGEDESTMPRPQRQPVLDERHRQREATRQRPIVARAPSMNNSHKDPSARTRDSTQAGVNQHAPLRGRRDRGAATRASTIGRRVDAALEQGLPQDPAIQAMSTPEQGLNDASAHHPRAVAFEPTVPTVPTVADETGQEQDETPDANDTITAPTSKVVVDVQNERGDWEEETQVHLSFSDDKPVLMQCLVSHLRLPIKLLDPGRKTWRVRSKTLGNLDVVGTVDFVARRPNRKPVRFEGCPVLKSHAQVSRWKVFFGLKAAIMLEFGDLAGGFGTVPDGFCITGNAGSLMGNPRVQPPVRDFSLAAESTTRHGGPLHVGPYNPGPPPTGDYAGRYAGAFHTGSYPAGPSQVNQFSGPPWAAPSSSAFPSYTTQLYPASSITSQAVSSTPYFGNNSFVLPGISQPETDSYISAMRNYGNITSAAPTFSTLIDPNLGNANNVVDDNFYETDQPQRPDSY